MIEPDLKIRGYVVAQVPNPPLWVALAAVIASRLLPGDSTACYVSRSFAYAGFIIWAYLELADGVNLFRRCLGAVGIAWVLASLTRELS